MTVQQKPSQVLSALSKNSQSKAIIFDASTLISFAMAGLYDELRRLKQSFNGKFLMTQEIKREVIDKPLTIKRFRLEGLKIKELFNEKVLELPVSVGVKNNEVTPRSKEMVEVANSTFRGRDRDIKLISEGEASCLVLSKILTDKGLKNVVAVDERTTRMLCEKPEILKRFLERKMHTKLTVDKEGFKMFKGFKLIRSAELIYIAYKKGLLKMKNGQVLDSLLWAVKYKGCSISREEIDEIKRLG